MHSNNDLQKSNRIFQHNREQSQLLFQRCNFLRHMGFGLVSRRLMLLQDEDKDSSPCFTIRQSESCFQQMNPSQYR